MKENNHHISVIGNSLKFNKEAVEILNLLPSDKLVIEYAQEDQIFVPVIMKTNFPDIIKGKKFTKSNSIMLRGEALKLLKSFGENFSLVFFDNPEIYQLISND